MNASTSNTAKNKNSQSFTTISISNIRDVKKGKTCITIAFLSIFAMSIHNYIYIHNVILKKMLTE